MKNKINHEWACCPNCGSGNLEHYDFSDKKTNETVKRVTHCKDCKLTIIEFFGEIFLQKNQMGIIDQEDIKKFQNFPRA